MEKILLTLLLISNICLGQTKISGTLPSLPDVQFSVKIDQSALNDYAGITLVQGKTDATGHFYATLDLRSEQSVGLFIGKTFFILWARPGNDLNIQETPDGSYAFSGPMEKENVILYMTHLMQPQTLPARGETNSFDPVQQLSYIDSIENARLKTLAETQADKHLSKKFISYFMAETKGWSYFNKNQYPALMKATNKIRDEDIPADYFKFWDGFTLEEDSSSSSSYQNALQNFIEYKASGSIGKGQTGSEAYWREIFTTTDKLLHQHPLSLQKQKSAYLLLLIKYFNFGEFTATEIENYSKQFPLSPSLSIINELWEKKRASTAVIPSFQLKNPEGKFVDIKDFRGKVLYLDFWGSWCKACLINMPASQSLKQKFEGDDIVFLYLDFYDSNEKWLHAIRQYKIDGIHLKVETKDEAYFNKVFNIEQGFPRYALVDKNGSLVTIAAPQPQEVSAYQFISKYLYK